MKRRTIGVDPKIIGQAIATIIAFALSFFAIELSAEVSSAIAVVVGLIAGALSPAPAVVVDNTGGVPPYHNGYSIIEVVIAVFVILILLLVLFRFLPEDADAIVAFIRSSWG